MKPADPPCPEGMETRGNLRDHLILGALTCLGVLAWEIFLYAYVLGGDEPRLSLLLQSAAWDAAVLLPMILASLACGLWSARRLGLGPKTTVGLFGAAALVGLFFLALMTPAVILRDLAFQSVAARPAEIARSASIGDLTPVLSESRFLCSLSPESGSEAAQRAWFEPLLSGLRTVLMLQFGLLPLMLSGLAILSRVKAPTAGQRQKDRRPHLAVAAVGLMASCSMPHDADPEKTNRAELAISPLTNPCTSGGAVRRYDVSAINVSITLNRFGDHDPGGFMYVLDSNISALRVQETAPLPNRVSIGLREDLIQPLVIRANLGECLQINFTNRLASGASSWHINGLPFTVLNQGSDVGLNTSSFATPGGSIAYQIPIPIDPTAERAYYFHEHGASRQRVAHGLFGALIVEPAGAQYLDPETGAPLTGSNWEAIIDMPPGSPDFREYALLYHEVGDEGFVGILDANNNPLPQIEPVTAVYRPGARGINYRSEPFRNRMALNQDKSQGYGSYMFGDPATPIPRSYLGEPTKTRLLHAGSELFHVHHLHGGGDRWRRNPKIEASDFATGLQKLPVQNALSTRLDSQSIGPGVGFTLEHECGAGGCQQAAGDFLFHCHIGHHYIAGMWAFWRVFDTRQTDLATLPDRTAAPTAVDSRGLIGLSIEGKTLVPAATLTNPTTERALEDWVEAQLPPQGTRLHAQDATVWDWDRVDDPSLGPLYFGEPDDTSVWANYQSPTPGVRPEILFNPNNGRYAWPLLRPHLAKRPPFSANGHSGAPWLGENGSARRPDGLCPDNAVLPNPQRQTRQYPITAIPISIPVNATTTDTGGRLYVLNEDKAAVKGGTKPASPLAIRSNVGDCVHVIFTNEIPVDTDQAQPKVNMHTHFVQFDPQASDGVISGLSYEQAVRPYPTVENRTLVNAASAGATTIDTTNVTDLRPGIWLGVGLGEGMCTLGATSVPCTEIRRITSIINTTITLDQPLALSHAVGQAVGVEFVQYNWYSDVDSGAVFWHDHVNFHSWGHGLIGSHIIEPAGSTYHDPATGAVVRSGAIVDIHAPATASIGAGQSGSFREFMVWTSNDTTLFNAAPGGANGLINMRSAPFSTRAANPAWTFSSVRWGDPATPLPRAYVGDPVVFRHIAVEKFIGGLRVSGHRFRLERFAASGALSDTAPVGVSERWDLVLDGGAGGPGGKPGDYLYYSTLGQELVGGAWGIFRVYDTLQSSLQVLPDRDPPPEGSEGFPRLTFTGATPPAATGAGTPCPGGAPVKPYNVTIAPASIQYSATKTDTNGVIYMLSGGSVPKPATEPLVLRVNQGDCLEVTLTNNLTTRAGFNVGNLLFDPQGSYGAAIGYNPDSSIPAGGTKLYRFYADEELGTNVLFNLANPVQGKNGAYGAIIVEPTGSTYRHPVSGASIVTGLQADILAPGGSFREFVALYADNDAQLGQDRMPYPTNPVDFSGLSYSAPRLVDRGSATNPAGVFNSTLWGDPRLLVKANAGDPITFRVAQAWGEQAHVFSVEGHRWAMEGALPDSEQIGQTYTVPFYSLDAQLTVGAGGDISATGDYLFGDRRQPYLEAGLWGLIRVSTAGSGGILALPGKSPLLLED